MDLTLRNLLGLVNDGKREYMFHKEDQVSQDEFAFCAIVHEVVFGPQGYAATLGPTWAMIHDPRFGLIENCFIINRKAVFGGDARLGKQMITTANALAEGSVDDLKQYSEILGEGRHFSAIVQGKADPRQVKDWDDEAIWALIRQECPNYWSKPYTTKDGEQRPGAPNRDAQTLFACFKADLLGLIHDYAPVANIQEWIQLETGELTTAAQMKNSENTAVWAEVDILDRALSYRASLRMTAAKILNDRGIKRMLRVNPVLETLRLTERERDELLKIVYSSSWPDRKLDLALQVNNYLVSCAALPFEVRELEQLDRLSGDARRICLELRAGVRQPITRFTEPEVEYKQTEEGRLMDEIQNNPFKSHLFLIYVAAEADKATPVVELLAPVFASADYQLDEAAYNVLVTRIQEITELQAVKVNRELEGTFETELTTPGIPMIFEATGADIQNLDADIAEGN